MTEKDGAPPPGYAVGYGKPPKHTQFKKGQSGNKTGRSKRVHAIKTLVLQELDERIDIREGTREKTITKQRALIKAIVAKAIKGDMRAASLLLAMVIPLQDAAAAQIAAVELTKDDKTLVELLTEYMKQQGKVP
jgi:hypothetical protein